MSRAYKQAYNTILQHWRRHGKVTRYRNTLSIITSSIGLSLLFTVTICTKDYVYHLGCRAKCQNDLPSRPELWKQYTYTVALTLKLRTECGGLYCSRSEAVDADVCRRCSFKPACFCTALSVACCGLSSILSIKLRRERYRLLTCRAQMLFYRQSVAPPTLMRLKRASADLHWK